MACSLYFSCFFNQKAYLESRFRSSEPVTKRAFREAGVNIERGLKISGWVLVLAILHILRHPPQPGVQFRAELIRSILGAWSSSMVMERKSVYSVVESKQPSKAALEGDLYLTCLLLECCR